ncbi:hypothetical protein P4O66_007678 [Electrophorus voltai]|uniref:Uncharacterized protein n=1 Tax=Electrophorus voltai TaxID=2609070 RepID=A0AAD8ZHE6_9TELE|nr:hypothetical protein P4O66_007678 [Electrophorus voltai]
MRLVLDRLRSKTLQSPAGTGPVGTAVATIPESGQSTENNSVIASTYLELNCYALLDNGVVMRLTPAKFGGGGVVFRWTRWSPGNVCALRPDGFPGSHPAVIQSDLTVKTTACNPPLKVSHSSLTAVTRFCVTTCDSAQARAYAYCETQLDDTPAGFQCHPEFLQEAERKPGWQVLRARRTTRVPLTPSDLCCRGSGRGSQVVKQDLNLDTTLMLHKNLSCVSCVPHADRAKNGLPSRRCVDTPCTPAWIPGYWGEDRDRCPCLLWRRSGTPPGISKAVEPGPRRTEGHHDDQKEVGRVEPAGSPESLPLSGLASETGRVCPKPRRQTASGTLLERRERGGPLGAVARPEPGRTCTPACPLRPRTRRGARGATGATSGGAYRTALREAGKLLFSFSPRDLPCWRHLARLVLGPEQHRRRSPARAIVAEPGVRLGLHTRRTQDVGSKQAAEFTQHGVAPGAVLPRHAGCVTERERGSHRAPVPTPGQTPQIPASKPDRCGGESSFP